MPRSDSEHLTKLRQIRDNLVTDTYNRTLEWAAAGSPPDYTVNGRSFQWTSWLKARKELINDLGEMIREAEVPEEAAYHAYT